MRRLESMAYLMIASNVNEADIIESILNMEHIPVHREEVEAGNYLKNYHGYSIYGVDLYVPIALIGQARKIISANESGIEEQNIETEDSFSSNRRRLGKIIVLIYVASHIASLIFISASIIWELLS